MLPSIGGVIVFNVELIIVSRLDSSVFAEDVVCNTSIEDDALGVVEIAVRTVSLLSDTDCEVSVNVVDVGSVVDFDSKFGVLVMASKDCVIDTDAVVVVLVARNFK